MITTPDTPLTTPARWQRIRFRLRALQNAAMHTAELACQIDRMRDLAAEIAPAMMMEDPHDLRLWCVQARQAGLLPLADGTYRGARSLVATIAKAILSQEGEG